MPPSADLRVLLAVQRGDADALRAALGGASGGGEEASAAAAHRVDQPGTRAVVVGPHAQHGPHAQARAVYRSCDRYPQFYRFSAFGPR